MGARIRDPGARARSYEPRGLPGQCAVLQGVDTCRVLSVLGPGKPLSPTLRQGMEAEFEADFSSVIMHTGNPAGHMAEHFGADAFAIGGHVAFGFGRFRPESALGRELLRHELAHTLDASAGGDRLRAWLTLLNNSGTPTYELPLNVIVPGKQVGTRQQITVLPGWPTSHEVMTEHALRYVGGYGEGAQAVIKRWSAELDNYKERLSILGGQFPELRLYSVAQLHAYGGHRERASPEDVDNLGMSNIGVLDARLTGWGLIGNLLKGSVRRFKAGSDREALQLLGISLHTIQDFYSHKVALLDCGGKDLRKLGLIGSTDSERGHNKDILEDDPNLDYRRWVNARHRTAEQLATFKQSLDDQERLRLRNCHFV